MSRPLVINWSVEDTEESLFVRYKAEKDTSLRTRLHALAMLRQGTSVAEVMEKLRVSERAVRRWISWHRKGGVEEVLAHKQGSGGGRPCFLDARQQGTLWAKVASGFFLTAREIREWIAERFGGHLRSTERIWPIGKAGLRVQGSETAPRKSRCQSAEELEGTGTERRSHQKRNVVQK